MYRDRNNYFSVLLDWVEGALCAVPWENFSLIKFCLYNDYTRALIQRSSYTWLTIRILYANEPKRVHTNTHTHTQVRTHTQANMHAHMTLEFAKTSKKQNSCY